MLRRVARLEFCRKLATITSLWGSSSKRTGCPKTSFIMRALKCSNQLCLNTIRNGPISSKLNGSRRAKISKTTSTWRKYSKWTHRKITQAPIESTEKKSVKKVEFSTLLGQNPSNNIRVGPQFKPGPLFEPSN
jgi:hypothetical protein